MPVKFFQMIMLSLIPVGKFVRRAQIKFELRNLQYQLAHIEATRRNDNIAERIVHRRQALLQSELVQLETQ